MYDKAFTLDDIRALNPCEDPTEYEGVTEEWAGTAQDILSAEHVPPDDRLWVVLRLDIPRRIKLEFAWWVANQARHLMLDKRSARALDVLRSYLDGNATADELRQTVARAKEASRAARAVAETATLVLQQEATVNTAARMALAAEAAALASEAAAWTWGSAVRTEIWAVSEVATWAGGRAAWDARQAQIRYLRTLLNAYTAPGGAALRMEERTCTTEYSR